MAAERYLYQCQSCSMEIVLIAPVERPCPRCGGTFTKMHPLDYKLPGMQEKTIDTIVAEVFPQMLLEIEQMLEMAANGE